MKKAFVITILIAMCLLLLYTGFVSVSADGGPTPNGVPIKLSVVQAVVLGSPHGVPTSKGISQISIVTGSPQEETAGIVQP